MENYKLKPLSDGAFAYVSFSLSAVGLDHYFTQLQSTLTSTVKDYRGRVLFDQLLSHGVKEGRFVSMYFDGNKFDTGSFKIETKLPTSVRQSCSQFYSRSPELLNEGILTQAQKFLIAKGRIV